MTAEFWNGFIAGAVFVATAVIVVVVAGIAFLARIEAATEEERGQ